MALCQLMTAPRSSTRRHLHWSHSASRYADFLLYVMLLILLTVSTEGAKSLDISYPVSQFKSYITDSDLYDENLMSVKVVHTR